VIIITNAAKSGRQGGVSVTIMRVPISPTEKQRHREVSQLEVNIKGYGAGEVQVKLRLVCI
jgi:hypothetical protein